MMPHLTSSIWESENVGIWKCGNVEMWKCDPDYQIAKLPNCHIATFPHFQISKLRYSHASTRLPENQRVGGRRRRARCQDHEPGGGGAPRGARPVALAPAHTTTTGPPP